MNWNMGYQNNWGGGKFLPHYDAPIIHGETEANNFAIGPNSSIFLPDADKDIIWWIKTDNFGTKTVTAFDVKIHEEPKPIDINSLVARLDAMEEQFNAKFNKPNSKRNRPAANAASTAEPVPTEL